MMTVFRIQVRSVTSLPVPSVLLEKAGQFADYIADCSFIAVVILQYCLALGADISRCKEGGRQWA
jgi:hypothetical protein